jgi:hypothetical protein
MPLESIGGRHEEASMPPDFLVALSSRRRTDHEEVEARSLGVHAAVDLSAVDLGAFRKALEG